jgi:hypothetical protein
MTPTRIRLDGIVRICRLFDGRPTGSWVHRATFENRRELIIRGVRVAVISSLHVVPRTGRDVPFQSSVTLWAGWHRRLRPGSTGWNSKLAAVGWYEACVRALELYGYLGQWERSPWGRHGLFWKMLKGRDAALAEVSVLDTVQALPWATFRAPAAARQRAATPRGHTGR